MENQIYRLRDGRGADLEFWIRDTNNVYPYSEIKELAVTLTNKDDDIQLDFGADENGIKSLIKYLEYSLEYIEEYNEASRLRFSDLKKYIR